MDSLSNVSERANGKMTELEKPQLKVFHGTGRKVKGGYMTHTKEGVLVFIAQETYRERIVRKYEEGRQMSSKIPYPGKHMRSALIVKRS